MAPPVIDEAFRLGTNLRIANALATDCISGGTGRRTATSRSLRRESRASSQRSLRRY